MLQRTMDRLLGPLGPEVTCDECFERIDDYVELELAGRDADAELPGMRAHFEGCPACDEDHAGLLAWVTRRERAPRPARAPRPT